MWQGSHWITNEPLSTLKMWSYEKKIYNENHLIKLWLRNWDVILCAELVLRLEANTAKTQPNQLEHVNPTFCHSPTVKFLFNGHESLPGTIWVSPRNAQSKCQFNNVAWIRLETTLWNHHIFSKYSCEIRSRGPQNRFTEFMWPVWVSRISNQVARMSNQVALGQLTS